MPFVGFKSSLIKHQSARSRDIRDLSYQNLKPSRFMNSKNGLSWLQARVLFARSKRETLIWIELSNKLFITIAKQLNFPRGVFIISSFSSGSRGELGANKFDGASLIPLGPLDV